MKIRLFWSERGRRTWEVPGGVSEERALREVEEESSEELFERGYKIIEEEFDGEESDEVEVVGG